MFPFLFLIALAIAPGLAIAIYIYWRDKFEKEPLKNLVICFLLGMVSIVPAILLENLPEQLGFFSDRSSITNTLLNAFVFVALVEELSKYLFLRLYAYPMKVFSEPYDGITYAVMISLGFATVENIHYVINGGWEAGIIRMFTAVPAHATFGVLMGFFTGLAKFRNHQTSYLILGLFSAILMHGTYDFFIIQQIVPGLYLGAFVSLIAGIWLSLIAIRIHTRKPKI